METVIITGGTGLIGRALSLFLVSRGYQVIIFSRNPGAHGKPSSGISYAAWNIDKQTINEEAIQKAKYIIHLAGAGVADKPWTAARKKEIVDSRVNSSVLLVKALKNIPNEIVSVVSASAIGWYNQNLPGPSIETDSPDTGFLGEYLQGLGKLNTTGCYTGKETGYSANRHRIEQRWRRFP